MRGQLRLTAAIADNGTFRRGGIAFAGRQPATVDVRDLDGVRLHQLIHEPLVTIEIADENGGFRPLPAIDRAATEVELQLMIDSLASQLPPRDGAAAVPPSFIVDMATGGVTPVNAIDADELAKRGFETVEQLLAAMDEADAKVAAAVAARAVAETDLATARAQITDLSGKLERAELAKSEVDALLADARTLIDDQKQFIAGHDFSPKVTAEERPKAVAKPGKPKASEKAG